MLSDAAQDADNFFFAGIFPVSAKPGKYFLGGLFANAAGVIENQPGRVHRFHLQVAAAEENSRYFFGIVDVHLAAERLDVEGIVSRRACGKRGHMFGRTDVGAGQAVKANIEWLRHSFRLNHIIPISGRLQGGAPDTRPFHTENTWITGVTKSCSYSIISPGPQMGRRLPLSVALRV